MQPPLFIGIDGGSSHCRARVRDATGRLLGEGVGGPANVHRNLALGLQSIRVASRAAIEAAGLDDASLGRAHAGLGIAGAGLTNERNQLNRLLAENGCFASTVVRTDAYIAWLGAHHGEDGAILILGTGSFGFGRVAGRWCHVGGWGAEVSDEASGQAVGREAIRRTLWAFDGRAPMTPLAQTILARFAGSPERIVAFARSATPADYAALAPIVFEHAARSDPLALALVGEAADHATRMITRLIEAGMPAISLTGGLAGSLAPWLARPIRDALTVAKSDALDGAILMAQRAQSSDRERVQALP